MQAASAKAVSLSFEPLSWLSAACSLYLSLGPPHLRAAAAMLTKLLLDVEPVVAAFRQESCLTVCAVPSVSRAFVPGRVTVTALI